MYNYGWRETYGEKLFYLGIPTHLTGMTVLGVTFDCALKFNKQISSVVKTSFFQLSRLSRVKACLQPHGLETVIQTFICSHLDDCNSLHAGSAQSLPRHLQVDQNAEARFFTGNKQCDHIAAMLASVDWL